MPRKSRIHEPRVIKSSAHEPPPLQNGPKTNVVRKKPEPPAKNSKDVIGNYLGNWDHNDPRTFLYADTGDLS